MKSKLGSGLEKPWGLSALLMSIFARFEFESAIYCNFCLCLLYLFIESFVVVLCFIDYLI